MRIRISKSSSDSIDHLTGLYGFKFDRVIARIAFAYSLQLNKKFEALEEQAFPSDGKDWRDDRALFGNSADDRSYYIVYKALLDQHYSKSTTEDEFVLLFKSHLDHGLNKILKDIEGKSTSTGYHFSYLLQLCKQGLNLISESSPLLTLSERGTIMEAFNGQLSVCIGKDEKGEKVILRINDLNEFDSCNMAIAGMVGSGKTELVKDILLQLSQQTNHQLKFIFFDYKGEGSPERLDKFLRLTNCEMVDLRSASFDFNPLSFIDLEVERTRSLNIRSFVDFVCTIAWQLGAHQKHILQTVITECFEQHKNLQALIPENYQDTHPTLNNVSEALQAYYSENGLNTDSLIAIIADLSTSIFKTEPGADTNKIYSRSLYLNLPLELSDTLRQLCVFLTLKYLLSEFSSTNDTEPNDARIKPMRYVIVIDEAHVYFKNKNASKALEEVLRTLRSKGVIVIMLSQGVEDYKTKDFDFSSQIKIPICLNVNNKDYRLIESFLGTPKSKQKLQEVINKLEPQKALINILEPKLIEINQFWRTIKE